MTEEDKTLYFLPNLKKIMIVTGFIELLAVVYVIVNFFEKKIQLSLEVVIKSLLFLIFCGALFVLIFGTTFVRIKNKRLYFTDSLFSWSSTPASNIKKLKFISRYSFSTHPDFLFLEYHEGGGLFGGIGFSRDKFSDITLKRIINKLKELNPMLEIDEAVSDFMSGQKPRISEKGRIP